MNNKMNVQKSFLTYLEYCKKITKEVFVNMKMNWKRTNNMRQRKLQLRVLKLEWISHHVNSWFCLYNFFHIVLFLLLSIRKNGYRNFAPVILGYGGITSRRLFEFFLICVIFSGFPSSIELMTPCWYSN